MTTALVGTRTLLQASLKHGGRNFAPWVALVTLLSVSSVIVYPWLFPDLADREAFAGAVGTNPALGLIFGPAFDLMTDEGFNSWRALALGGFLVGLGSIFTVTALTRGQEDSGQAELLASGVLGRGSRLATGVGVAIIGALAAGIVSGLFTVLFGGAWEESMLLAATFTITGWMFAGLAAVTAQLGTEARTSNSLAVGLLGTLFVMRGFVYSVGGADWLIWANPLGWMTETRPASGNHWAPLLYGVGLMALALTCAFVIQSRRDFGQGALAPRPGPARGKVSSVSGLVWRLNGGFILTWTVAALVLGTVFGFFTRSVPDILRADTAVTGILAAGATTPDELIGAFLVMIFSLLGIIMTIPGIQIMVRLRHEELADRVEPVLAGAVSRTRLYASAVRLAFLVPAALMLIAGVILAFLATGAGIGIDFGDAIMQAAVTIPAVWTVIALSVAIVGVRPHVLIAAWAGTVISFALTVLGPSFRLWDWALAISPFWHVPGVSVPSPYWLGLVWISIVTGLFLLAGFRGFRTRDIAV